MRNGTMAAKRASVCPWCAVPIPVGARIGRGADGRWGHVDCRSNALTLTAAVWVGSPTSGRWVERQGEAADAARAYLGEGRSTGPGTSGHITREWDGCVICDGPVGDDADVCEACEAH